MLSRECQAKTGGETFRQIGYFYDIGASLQKTRQRPILILLAYKRRVFSGVDTHKMDMILQVDICVVYVVSIYSLLPY